MKQTKIFLSMLAVAAMFSACKPEFEGELGDPSDKVKGLSGVWELEQFVVQDPNNPILEERDFSEFYIVDGVQPLRLTLNLDDKTYSTESTLGKNPFGASGTWELDDEFAPSYFTMYGTNDTIRVDLKALVLETSDKMGLIYNRGCSDGFKSVTYKYNFKRVQ